MVFTLMRHSAGGRKSHLNCMPFIMSFDKSFTVSANAAAADVASTKLYILFAIDGGVGLSITAMSSQLLRKSVVKCRPLKISHPESPESLKLFLRVFNSLLNLESRLLFDGDNANEVRHS